MDETDQYVRVSTEEQDNDGLSGSSGKDGGQTLVITAQFTQTQNHS